VRSMAILTDVSRCIGCEECVQACKRANHLGDDRPYGWQDDATALSAERWTTIVRAPRGRYVRLHCRHCLEPACASACPVGALRRSEWGAVTYDPDICMGCRYCMVACPFLLTRYEWASPTPRVRKCILCFDAIREGRLEEPACTAACPARATVFGERDELLAEAWRRIESSPGKYLHRVWGEHEVGGTSVLYISDVDLSSAGWSHDLRRHSYPALTSRVLKTVPATFVGVSAAMFGLSWVIGRRMKLAARGTEPAAEGARRGGEE